MNNSLIIGQYVPGKSLVHRLDPRTKITIIFFCVFFVVFANSFWSYSIFTAFAFISVLITHIPIKFILKGLTPVWFLIAFTFLLHIFITKEGTVLLKVFSLEIYTGGII